MSEKGNNTVEHLLERTAQRLSLGLTALERYLSKVSDKFQAAVVRAGRFIREQIRLGLRNLRYLLGLLSIFLALVWIASGFHELTFHDLWLLKWLGWAGTSLIALIALGGLLALFFPSKEESPKRALTGSFILLHTLALTLLGLAIYLGYDFRSPALKWAQISMRSAVEKVTSLRNHYYLSESQAVSVDTRQSTSPPSQRSEKQHVSEVPAPVPIPVECQSPDGTNWVPADWNKGATPLNMWVERMWLINGNTVLDVAVRGWYRSGTVDLDQAKGAYLVDDVGKAYPLVDDSGDYSFFLGEHTVIGDEIYRFQLTFPGLDHYSKYMYLHHPQFREHILNICPHW